jgi:hypothetical protein
MLRLLRRHSRVAWALGAVGLLFVVFVIASAPAQYRAKGSLVLLNPPVMPSREERPEGFKANPYAEQGYTGVDLARIVKLRMTSEGEKLYIRDKLGVKGNFDVGANLGVNSTPLVDVTVTSGSADQAKAETSKLLQRFSEVLRAIQFEATPGATNAPGTQTDYPYLWTTNLISPPDKAAIALSSTIRRGVAGLFLAAVLLFGGVLLAEWIGRRRAARKAASEEFPDGDESLTPEQRARARAMTYVFDTLPTHRNRVWQIDFAEVETSLEGVWRIAAVVDASTQMVLAASCARSARANEAIATLEAGRQTAERLIRMPLAEDLDSVGGTRVPVAVVTDAGAAFRADAFVRYIELHEGVFQHVLGTHAGPGVDKAVRSFLSAFRYEFLSQQRIDDGDALLKNLEAFITRYNFERRNDSLAYSVPARAYGVAKDPIG